MPDGWPVWLKEWTAKAAEPPEPAQPKPQPEPSLLSPPLRPLGRTAEEVKRDEEFWRALETAKAQRDAESAEARRQQVQQQMAYEYARRMQNTFSTSTAITTAIVPPSGLPRRGLLDLGTPIMAGCAHRNWRLYDTDRIGYVSCLDCGMAVQMGPVLERMRGELMDAVARLDSVIRQLDAPIAPPEPAPAATGNGAARPTRVIELED